MYARGVTAIELADESLLDDSVAAIHRKTGVLYVNQGMIRRLRLTKAQVFFILLHEMAHVLLNTSDELAVDKWAHEQYLKRGYSLKESVFAHTKLLRFDKTEDFVRATLQLKRAQQYDHEHYR